MSIFKISIILILSIPLSASAQDVPKTQFKLKSSLSTYESEMITNGNSSEKYAVEVKVTEADSGYVVRSVANPPMGKYIEVTLYDKASYLVAQRWINFGARDMHFVFGATDKSYKDAVVVTTDHQIFADGAGSYHVLALLPLKVGYETGYYNYNIRAKSADKMLLKVIRKEIITVKAGTFNTWVLELKHENGSPGLYTIWVSQDSNRYVVRNTSEFNDTKFDTRLVKVE